MSYHTFKMNELQIVKGTTRSIIKIPIMHEYAPYIKTITKDILTDYEWDQVRCRKVELKGFSYYDKNTKELYIPINALPPILDTLKDIGANFIVTDELAYPERSIDLKMRDDFVPKPEQVDIIKYLAAPTPHRKGLATATGSGKTVSTIAGIVEYGKAAMIIVSGLQDQWVRQIQHFTNIGDKIYLVQGFGSLVTLVESEIKPDIIVFSLETLRLYVKHQDNYAELPTLDSMLKYFGIGIKVMDEVHMNFHAQTLVDLSSNVNNNIYLTATFGASNFYTKKIIDLIYPKEMRYGEHTHEKHIAVFCYTFRGEVPERACMRRRGYMHAKYETYLLKKKYAITRYFDYVLMTIIQEQYILRREPGEKMLIYFARTSMVEYACNWLRLNFPKYKVEQYIGGIKDTVLDTADILVTTPKKSGAGTDIKNLLFVLNTVSIKTCIGTEQMRGRLRPMKNGRFPSYAEVVDLNIPAHTRHMRERSYVHKQSAKSYKVLNL